MAQGSVLKYPYSYPLVTGGGANANAYVNDRGQTSATGSVLVLPTDIASDANATTIITAAGGTTASGGICSDRGTFKPRKAQFIRSNGSTISIVLKSPATIIADATAIRNALNGLSATFPVVCIKLIGESYTNLIQELRTATTAIGAGPPPVAPTTYGKAFIKFKGSIQYKRDVTAGTVLTGFAMNSDAVTGTPPGTGNTSGLTVVAPTIAAAEIDTCLGTVTQTQKCTGRNTFKPRHYIPTFLTTEGVGATGTSTLKVPEATGTAASILACGQALANGVSIICLGYQGESDPRLHKLLA